MTKGVDIKKTNDFRGVRDDLGIGFALVYCYEFHCSMPCFLQYYDNELAWWFNCALFKFYLHIRLFIWTTKNRQLWKATGPARILLRTVF